MGCDIHLHTEIKVGGVWHHYSQPRIGRSYELFCKLAGTRGPIEGIEPIAASRGVPADMSFTTRLDYMHALKCYDAHHQSWLTGKELAEVIKWNDERGIAYLKRRNEENGTPHASAWFSTEHDFFGYFFGNGWEPHPQSRGTSYPEVVEDVRAVFWFDN